ncbi:MAG: CehA/McbA family metallohydrolase [Desulfobacteraceae bacterium]|nr:MAG: CehA/McbA family metallohydrolase [Desulfobacteraceae bacterium]
MVFDIHIHTRRYSTCSNIEPEDLLRRAKKIGLDGIALTEHGIRWPDKKVEALRVRAKITDLVIVIGQEISCFENGKMEGHFLVFGFRESMGSNIPARELIKKVHGEGGIVIPAHPFKRSRMGDDYYGVGDRIYGLDIDAIELYHPEHDKEAILKVQEVSRKMGVPLTGGSDAHGLSEIGSYTTLFEDEVLGDRQFIEAIRAGRIAPQKGLTGS